MKKKVVIIHDGKGAIRIQNMDYEDINTVFNVLKKYGVNISLSKEEIGKEVKSK